MTNYGSTTPSMGIILDTRGSPLSENEAGFMAAGEKKKGGGKHNKAHSSLEFNVLGQKTEYRYQRPGLLEKKKKKLSS